MKLINREKGIGQAWSSRKQELTWGIDVHVDGKRIRRTGFTSREEAEAAAGEIESLASIKIGSIGATAELAVSVDLLRLGFDVFRSVSPNAACDILALRSDGTSFRVEVKSAIKRKGVTRFKRHRLDPKKYDVLALVFLRENQIEYRDPENCIGVQPNPSTNRFLTVSI